MRKIAIFLAFLMILFLLPKPILYAHLKGSEGGYSCRAEALYNAVFRLIYGTNMGGYCEITCFHPHTPHCKAGLFSVDCHCDVGGRCPGRIIPNLGDVDFAIVNNFINWCSQYSTINMTNLALASENVKTAFINNDENAFSYYEDEWDSIYDNLTEQEKNDIDNWINNYQ